MGRDQTAVCEIPSFTLVPGEYTMLVALIVHNIGVDAVQDAVRINVVESDYYGTGKVPWNDFIVLKHRWYMEQNGTLDERVSTSKCQVSSSNPKLGPG